MNTPPLPVNEELVVAVTGEKLNGPGADDFVVELNEKPPIPEPVVVLDALWKLKRAEDVVVVAVVPNGVLTPVPPPLVSPEIPELWKENGEEALVLVGLEKLKEEATVVVFNEDVVGPPQATVGVEEKLNSEEVTVLILRPPKEDGVAEVVVDVAFAADFAEKSKNVEGVVVAAEKLSEGIDLAGVNANDVVVAETEVIAEANGKTELDFVLSTLAEKLNTGGGTVDPTLGFVDTDSAEKLKIELDVVAVMPGLPPLKLKPN